MARIGEIQDFDSSHLYKRGETMTASIINKTFKSIVAASAALIMAASVAACGPSAATPSDEGSANNDSSSSSSATARTLDEIKKSGELKVAVFSDKAPFGYIDKEGKKRRLRRVLRRASRQGFGREGQVHFRRSSRPRGRAHLQQGGHHAGQLHRHRRA